ncbi:LTA synthase family protein [Castellaniella sp.]|uniref:LTA synthase family protein n=1 Tax=Castellaniella sp. TaxID=1955812 RepID=UPI002AFF9339|nr:LTA synthase family protein [Castellaniella sp.]
MNRESLIRSCFVLLPYALLLLGRVLLPLLFDDGSGYPASFLMPFLFSLLLFQLLACLLHPVSAALSSLLLESLLLQANQVKISQAGEPVTARDLIEFWQAMQLTSYAPVGLYIALGLLLVCLYCGWRYREPGWKPFFGRLPLAVPMLALIWVFMFSNGNAGKISKDFLCRSHICYYAWVPAANARINGALAHLVMTSEAVKMPRMLAHDFYRRAAPAMLNPDKPDVLMILCESCFTTFDDGFKTPMMSLIDQGMVPFYMLSPVYGGNTAEAEFEVLTGLSSAVLPGIDYQNFFDRFRDKADTLVNRFARAGYDTISMNNYKSSFWKIKTVHSKFGFNYSRFIEDMDPSGKLLVNMHPGDGILYENALDHYRQVPSSQSSFLYLITMHTHGDYANRDGDFGEHDYLQRFAEAMADMNLFLHDIKAAAKAKGRPLAVIVYGDHKPALAGTFYKNGVLPKALFSGAMVGSTVPGFVLQPDYSLWKARAQVSAFIQLPDKDATDALADRLNDKPLFCLSAELSALVPGVDDAFWASVNAICRQPDARFMAESGNPWTQFFPEGIYAERLF